MPTTVEHRGSGDVCSRHNVSLASGTILGTLAGKSEVEVNSSHHQAIDRLAAALMPAAVAPDGVIEAATYCEGYPVLAVQWHPEKNFREDPFSRRLFVHFVAQCKGYRDREGNSTARNIPADR